MKNFILALAILFLTCTFAYGFESSISSGEKTSDAQVAIGNGAITAFEVITDGTNDAKIIIYDNTAASGKVLNEMTVIGGAHFGGREPMFPPEFYTGIYVDVSGTGASYIVEYKLR